MSHYNGNTNLRPVGFKRVFSTFEREEFIKCKKDITHFYKYASIISLDEGIIPFSPRPYQSEFISLNQQNRFMIALQCRQSGKSTTAAILLAHYIIFNKSKSVAVLAQSLNGSKELLGRIKLIIELLPSFLKPNISDWSKLSITLENGSRVITSSSNGDGLRGLSVNFLVLDEFAFLPDADDFLASVFPVISSSKKSKILIISTPNGLNHFYEIYRAAELKLNGFAYMKIDYSHIPHYDKAWKIETIQKIGHRKFAREFGCDFQGSSQSLIDGHFIADMLPNPNFKEILIK